MFVTENIRDVWWGDFEDDKILFELLANDKEPRVELELRIYESETGALACIYRNDSLWHTTGLVIWNKNNVMFNNPGYAVDRMNGMMRVV